MCRQKTRVNILIRELRGFKRFFLIHTLLFTSIWEVIIECASKGVFSDALPLSVVPEGTQLTPKVYK